MKKKVAIFLLLLVTVNPLLSMKDPNTKKQTWFEYFKMQRDQFFAFFMSANTEEDKKTAQFMYERELKLKQRDLIRIDQSIIRHSNVLDRPYITINNEGEENAFTATIDTLDSLLKSRALLVAKYPELTGNLSMDQLNELSARVDRIKRALTAEINLRYKTGIPAEFTPYTVEDRRPPVVVEPEPVYPGQNNTPLDYKK